MNPIHNPNKLGQKAGKQDYKQDLLDAIMAVKPTRGNYTGWTNTDDGIVASYDASTSTRADISDQMASVYKDPKELALMKAARQVEEATAMTQAAITGCAELMKEKGRLLTQDEIKSVIMGLAG
ncbi:hypothetical protein [Pseudomonas sp. p1(2021b)]|uniref:hypothetical protein n=1 Tax=Pseudomonas sp. p1(2021b) TaxID=2874628 RepID=UPI003D283C11